MDEHASAEFAQRFDGENFGLHFGHVLSALSENLRRQNLPASFCAKRNQEQTDHEGYRGQGDRRSQRLKMLHASADEKSDSHPAKSCKGGGEGKCACAALVGYCSGSHSV